MEDQGSATFLPALTNPSSHNITVIVVTVNGTAVGKIVTGHEKICV